MRACKAVAASYALGYSPEEFTRLERQGALLAHLTADVLQRAGLVPGMRVLDVGCGVGDVSLLAAGLVGPSGAVLGVDRSAESVAIAQRRAMDAGANGWTRFETSEFDDFEGTTLFDAVIGRLVLMYQPDPAAFVRRLAGLVRPGGIVAFHEVAMPMMRSVPEGPVFRRTMDWIVGTFRAAGFETDMGSKLAQSFVDAGLPRPTMTLAGNVAVGARSPVHAYIADTLRSLLPTGARLGVFSSQEAGLETLTERLAAEAEDLGACIMGPPLVGAWTRKV
jgi:2-polyprenyl-3-methyl-5-hydroxy-6-metoxy-1,4-benzoquinol methylase